MNIQVIQVVPHIDREASGLSYSVPRLSASVAAQGADVELFCCRAPREVPGVSVRAFPQWPVLQRFGVSPSLATSLRERARSVDVVHNHSLWAMANVAAGWSTRGTNARLVLSPRGTLAPWARQLSKSKKRLIWPLQKRALLAASLVHATSEEEIHDVRRAGFRGPVALIPNGIDIPPASADFRADANPRRVTFLSRVHPTKGLETLIDAWSRVCLEYPDWELSVVGIGKPAYEASLKDRAREMNAQRLSFPGALYGKEKLDALFRSQLFVLPTHSENFGIAVAEALASGLPAIVTHGAPWEGLLSEHCGWWIPKSVPDLTTTLREAMAISPEGLQEMGLRGRDWMRREFSWEKVGREMHETYLWLLGRREQRPEWVRID